MIVLAHGGTAGAVAEATFLALPVLLFFLLSKWSKRRARKADQSKPEHLETGDPKGRRPPTEGRPDRTRGADRDGGPS